MFRRLIVLSVFSFSVLSLSGCSWLSRNLGIGGGSTDTAEGTLSQSELDAKREARFGEGSIPLAEDSGPFRDVSFDYNSSSITDLGRQSIEFNADVLNQNSALKITIEGHCDERGTSEYNMALGADRARGVKDVLASLGINRDRVETVSYGEEVPLDAGHTEAAWGKNRRVHFSAH